MADARKTALHALLRVSVGDGFSNIVLDEALQKADLSAADVAFASAVFYGVIERRLTLDAWIDRYAKKAPSAPLVREVLRLGAYQIAFMDRVPDSAAVNESVGLVKDTQEFRAAGFVNAVLRQIVRDQRILLDFRGDSEQALSVRYSAPVWLIRNLIADYGRENAVGFLADSLSVPPIYIRVNTLKISAEELKSRLTAQGISAADTPLATALRLDRPGSFEKNPLFLDGLFFAEDLASQLCVEVLAPKAGETVLDLCAAPGGKSFAAALKMQGRGRVVSCDLYESRCRLIEDGRRRLGLDMIEPMVNDAAKTVPEGSFDRVLCDVPCSGFGIIRRKPDIKYKNPDDLKELPPLALSILENGASAVRAGGRLVYSTCTLRKSENQKVVGRFLSAHPEFTLEPIVLPGFHSVTDDGCLTLMPQFGGTDGFFVASMIKAAVV